MTVPPEETAAKKTALVEALLNGHTVSGAAKQAGIDRSTYYKWRKGDEDFDKAAKDAIGQQISVVEDALYARAIAGNVTAQIFYLCNRAGDKWHHVNRVEHTVPEDGSFVINIQPAIDPKAGSGNGGANGGDHGKSPS